mmetsp:Transcript_1294/g.5159  ORF Transcript_1294/g.5159 Transcript_1294/m.5159 type:complete len:219 (+) Transcript_1294:518-1174(+)
MVLQGWRCCPRARRGDLQGCCLREQSPASGQRGRHRLQLAGGATTWRHAAARSAWAAGQGMVREAQGHAPRAGRSTRLLAQPKAPALPCEDRLLRLPSSHLCAAQGLHRTCPCLLRPSQKTFRAGDARQRRRWRWRMRQQPLLCRSPRPRGARACPFPAHGPQGSRQMDAPRTRCLTPHGWKTQCPARQLCPLRTQRIPVRGGWTPKTLAGVAVSLLL